MMSFRTTGEFERRAFTNKPQNGYWLAIQWPYGTLRTSCYSPLPLTAHSLLQTQPFSTLVPSSLCVAILTIGTVCSIKPVEY